MKKRYRKMEKKANGRVREIGEGSVLLELPLSVAGVIESLPMQSGIWRKRPVYCSCRRR